jgi:hypothetical protein
MYTCAQSPLLHFDSNVHTPQTIQTPYTYIHTYKHHTHTHMHTHTHTYTHIYTHMIQIHPKRLHAKHYLSYSHVHRHPNTLPLFPCACTHVHYFSNTCTQIIRNTQLVGIHARQKVPIIKMFYTKAPHGFK